MDLNLLIMSGNFQLSFLELALKKDLEKNGVRPLTNKHFLKFVEKAKMELHMYECRINRLNS